MSGRRNFSARSGRSRLVQTDIERSLGSLRDEIPGIAAAASYTPGEPASWAGAAPTTVVEALDRLAAAYASSHAPVP